MHHTNVQGWLRRRRSKTFCKTVGTCDNWVALILTSARISVQRLNTGKLAFMLAIASLAAATVGMWFWAVKELRAPPVKVTAQPAAIVWGNRVFSSRKSLDVWLHARGSSYEAWARRHSGAIDVIEPTPQPLETHSRRGAHSAPTSSAGKVTRPKAAPATATSSAAAPSAAKAARTPPGRAKSTWLLALIGFAALVIAGFGSVPDRVWMRFRNRPLRPQARLYAFGVAATIAVSAFGPTLIGG